MPARFIAWLFIAIGVLASWPARAVVGQELALAARSPQFLYVSSASARPVEVDVERTAALRQVVSLQVERPTLGLLLAAIEEQTGLTFAYDNDFQPHRPVTLRADSITVASALAGMLHDTGVDVVLSAGGHVALVKRPAAPPTGSITGNVTNAQSGEAIEGVEVHLQGTRWRTLTGTDGQYRLANVDTGTYVVAARRIGYTRQSRSITVVEGQETTADFALQAAVTTLGEVVVTAQKREERLQDVPLSIAAVTLEEIDRRGLVSAEDYLRGIPGVNQTTEGHGQSIVIRGLETSLAYQNFFGAATVATYFGETPTTSSQGVANYTNVDLKLMDIERVEMLRGPQGTAFGSSALGGVVRTIPVAPKLDRFEGKVVAGYSGTSGTGGDNYNLQGVGNFPLIKDKLALRAMGYRHEQSGFYRNVAGSDPTFQSAVVAPYDAQAFATDAEEVGNTRFTGGRGAALFQASDDLKFTLSYLKQKSETDGMGIATTGSYEQAGLEVAPEHVDRGQRYGLFDNDLDLANAMMEYNLGWANLLATYSYLKSRSTYVYSFSLFLPWPMSFLSPSDHRGHFGEIRLATQLDGAWNFLGGLYAEDLDDEATFHHYWHGSPETNFFVPGQSGTVGEYRTRRNLKQKAAFAEASWEFLPGVTLTGGVRAYNYDRTELTSSEGATYGNFGPVSLGADASGTSFRGNLSHKLNDNALVYAGWSQGFRLGRAQTGLGPGCDPDADGIVDGTSITIESTRIVQSDNVDNYELGGKFTLLDGRLMIAADAYRIDWADVPVTVNVTNLGGVGLDEGCYPLYTANAGIARSEGIEFQANFYVTEAFRVDLGGSWIRARLTEDLPALDAPAGTRLPGSPEFNANLGLQYEFKIGGSEAFVRADPIYVGPFRNSLNQLAPASAGGYVKVDASARVAIRNTSIDLFVRNVTNEDDFTSGGGALANPFTGYRLRPRTIGLQLSRDF